RFRLRRAAKSASRPRMVPFPRPGVSGLASALARHDLRRPAGGRAGGNSTAILLPFVGKLVIKLRVEFLGAIRTDSMGEVGVRVILDIDFDFVPAAFFVPDFLARGADGQQ